MKSLMIELNGKAEKFNKLKNLIILKNYQKVIIKNYIINNS